MFAKASAFRAKSGDLGSRGCRAGNIPPIRRDRLSGAPCVRRGIACAIPRYFFGNNRAKKGAKRMNTFIFNDGENFRNSICDLFAPPRGQPFNPDAHLFRRTDYLPKRGDWSGFFRRLVREVQSEGAPEARYSRAYWYVVGNVDSTPWPLPEINPETGAPLSPGQLAEWGKRRKILEGVRAIVQSDPARFSADPEGAAAILGELHRRKTKIERRFRGFAAVQRAIARAHRIEFRRSGGIRFNLFTEKLEEEKTTDVNLAVDMTMLKDEYDIAVVVSGDQDFVPAVHAVQSLGKKAANVSFRTKNGKLLPNGAWRLNKAVDQSIVVDYDTFRKFLFPEKL